LKRIAVILLILLPGLIEAQENPLFDKLMATSAVEPSAEKVQQFSNFVQRLRQKEVKSEKKLLVNVVRATQRKFLKTYSLYPDLSETLESGRFDCLTATSLLSIVLAENNFDFRIMETNYHIFILVNTSEGQVLLETTDRLAGLIDNPKEINQRIASYRQPQNAISASGKTFYQFSFSLYEEVKPEQLTGLLYFNRAVRAYNQNELLACSALLERSRKIYNSPRIEELAVVLVRSVLESDLPATAKGKVIQQYRSYVMSKNSPIASR